MTAMLRQLSRAARRIQAASTARVAARFRQAHRHRIRLLRHTALIRLIVEERRGAVGVGGIEREGGHIDHTHRHHHVQILKHHLAGDVGRLHLNGTHAKVEVDLLQMGLLEIRKGEVVERVTLKHLMLARQVANEAFLSLLLVVDVTGAARTLPPDHIPVLPESPMIKETLVLLKILFMSFQQS